MLGKYEVEQHELALPREAVHTVDDLDALAAAVAAEGATLGLRPHPALAEASLAAYRPGALLGALRLPSGDEDDRSGASVPAASTKSASRALREAQVQRSSAARATRFRRIPIQNGGLLASRVRPVPAASARWEAEHGEALPEWVTNGDCPWDPDSI